MVAINNRQAVRHTGHGGEWAANRLPEVSANIHHNEAPEALSQRKALIGHYASRLNSRLSKEMLFIRYSPILLFFQQLTWHLDDFPHGIL